jgi:hypothetical protein
MDNEFIEKMNSISVFEKLSETEQRFAFSAAFDKDKDGMITITADEAEFVYQLKPLKELYAEHESKKNIEEEMMSLLYHIESTIKGYDIENNGLTDTSVIMALEQISMKPEAPAQDMFLRIMTGNLRMFMSTHCFSRSQLRQGINRVLRSVRRHNKIDGTRGYLDFIREHVP